MSQSSVRWITTLIGLVIGLSLGLGLTAFTGENPIRVLQILLNGAFSTSYGLGMTLFLWAPLILCGMAVVIPFRAGLFNVGAEGQLTMGAFAAAVTGILLKDWDSPTAQWAGPCISALMAFLAGAAWGGIAGWLRVKRGSHEVISTIMLNFIAYALTSYGTLYLFKRTDAMDPSTEAVGPAFILNRISWFDGAPVTVILGLVVVVVVLLEIYLRKSRFGFELKSVGLNETAAQFSGMNPGRTRMLAMALGGGFAGCVGIVEVLGNSGRFIMGFSPGYGFIGIAVALLARGNGFAVLPSAFLFAALQKGAGDLDMETETVTREVSSLFQAFVILSVGASVWLEKKWVEIFPRRGSES